MTRAKKLPFVTAAANSGWNCLDLWLFTIYTDVEMVIDRVHSKKYPNSIVLKDVSWRFYESMLREFDEQPSRINYSRGTLEIMTLSIEHERYKIDLAEMLGMIALTFRIRMVRGGSSTLKRITKRKGLEADLCYWIANEAPVRT